jgi:hypothetical protein
VIRRLATSQARGERQLSFVNELLTFDPVPFKFQQIPGIHAEEIRYGHTSLPGQSWRNLRKRLISVGFTIERDWKTQTITMHFPEMRI